MFNPGRYFLILDLTYTKFLLNLGFKSYVIRVKIAQFSKAKNIQDWKYLNIHLFIVPINKGIKVIGSLRKANLIFSKRWHFVLKNWTNNREQKSKWFLAKLMVSKSLRHIVPQYINPLTPQKNKKRKISCLFNVKTPQKNVNLCFMPLFGIKQNRCLKLHYLLWEKVQHTKTKKTLYTSANYKLSPFELSFLFLSSVSFFVRRE